MDRVKESTRAFRSSTEGRVERCVFNCERTLKTAVYRHLMTTGPILLVEDEPTNVFFFQHAATKAGITNPIHVAKDGQEALDYLEGMGEFGDRLKYPLPDLVVLDLKLPRATGLEVLQRVRSNPRLRSLIVVMLTSSASDEDIKTAYALGASAYLVKPFNIGELFSLVQAIKDFWLTHNHPPSL